MRAQSCDGCAAGGHRKRSDRIGISLNVDLVIWQMRSAGMSRRRLAAAKRRQDGRLERLVGAWDSG